MFLSILKYNTAAECLAAKEERKASPDGRTSISARLCKTFKKFLERHCLITEIVDWT